MLNQFKIKGFEGRQIIETTLFFDNNCIFIDNEDYYSESNPLGWCPGIFKHNISSDRIERYTFSQSTSIISYECSNATLYYAFIEKSDGVKLRIRKLNCDNFTDTEILALTLKNDIHVEPHKSPYYNIRLFGVSERYVIVALPHFNYKCGDTHYSKLILLDSDENKYYTIPTKLGEFDSLLDSSSISVGEQAEKKYVLIKTGLLSFYEKENNYKKQMAKEKQGKQCNDYETIVCIDTDSFIKCIKEGVEIPERFIIDTCDSKCSFAYFTIYGGNARYQKLNFISETSEIVKYYPESGERCCLKFDGASELIVLLDSEHYCVKYTHEGQTICDINDNKIIYRTARDEHFLHFDDKENNVITYQSQDSLNSKVFLHNLKNNKSEILGEGWVTFDSQHQILTIFEQKK